MSKMGKELEKRLDENKYELYEELLEADAVICELCIRLNPQHANCEWCDDREPRLKLIAKIEGVRDG